MNYMKYVIDNKVIHTSRISQLYFFIIYILYDYEVNIIIFSFNIFLYYFLEK